MVAQELGIKIISRTEDVIFLDKSFGDCNKVKKATVVTVSYEGLDDEEEVKTVFNQNENNK